MVGLVDFLVVFLLEVGKLLLDLLKNSSKSIRFFGGMRFDSSVSISEEWRDWGSALFTLPMVELSIINNDITLACHILKDKDFKKRLQELQKILENS